MAFDNACINQIWKKCYAMDFNIKHTPRVMIQSALTQWSIS